MKEPRDPRVTIDYGISCRWLITIFGAVGVVIGAVIIAMALTH